MSRDPEEERYGRLFTALDAICSLVQSKGGVVSFKSVQKQLQRGGEGICIDDLEEMAEIAPELLRVVRGAGIYDCGEGCDEVFVDMPRSKSKSLKKIKERSAQFHELHRKGKKRKVVMNYDSFLKDGKCSIGSAIEALKQTDGLEGTFVHQHVMKSTRERIRPISSEMKLKLHPKLLQLSEPSLDHLYHHQSLAIEAFLSGNHVLLSTRTCSGKSLAFNLPTLHFSLQNSQSTALYLFPTKALAQDQLRSLKSICRSLAIDENLVNTFDGDLSLQDRYTVLSNTRILLANPDILHAFLLPSHRHPIVSKFIQNIHHIVLDELHTYNGSFGTHLSFLFIRLQRLVQHKLQIFCCSATIANPSEFFFQMFPRSVFSGHLIVLDSSSDGSPHSEKTFLLCCPQSNTMQYTALILSVLLQLHLKSIAFCKGRKTAELLVSTIPTDHLGNRQCAVYRGGLSAETRRNIERRLFNDEIQCVCSTNALELGIDIGKLDVSLHLGFPGSISSLFQQAGRAGRRSSASLSILVAESDPLDRFIMNNPKSVFKQRFEQCAIAVHNPLIRKSHLLCAAYEKPLLKQEYLGVESIDAISALCDESSLKENEVGWIIWGDSWKPTPSGHVTLRRSNSNTFSVFHGETVIDIVETSKALFELYPGAVVLVNGQTFQIESIDWIRNTARAVKRKLNYYTKCRGLVKIQTNASPLHLYHFDSHFGRCEITSTIFGYNKMRSGVVLESVLLNSPPPPLVLKTDALWINIPSALFSFFKSIGISVKAGTHAVNHLIRSVVALRVSCDPNVDLSSECFPNESSEGPLRILIYDNAPGGLGVCQSVKNVLDEVVRDCCEAIERCVCENGCIACIHSGNCKERNSGLDKSSARRILNYLRNGSLYALQ